MRIRNLNNTAFSLLEILLASIIFIITIGGVFLTLNAVRIPVADKESALAAAVFGKQVLESLRSSVNAGTFYNADATCTGSGINIICTDFTLALGTHQVPNDGNSWPSNLLSAWPSSTWNSSNSACSPTPCLVYSVTCADGSNPQVINGNPPDCVNTSGSAPINDISRQVTLSINWPEAT